jgi:hypothetical protein
MDFSDFPLPALNWGSGMETLFESSGNDLDNFCETTHVLDSGDGSKAGLDELELPSFTDDLEDLNISFLDPCNDFSDFVFPRDALDHEADLSIPSANDTSEASNVATSDDVVDEDQNRLDPQSKRARKRFSRESVQLLRQWLREHADNPYPTAKELDELKKETGMKRSQIRTWLANTRRRSKANVPKATPSINGVQQLLTAGESSSGDSSELYSALTPFDRYEKVLILSQRLCTYISLVGECLGRQKNRFQWQPLPTP